MDFVTPILTVGLSGISLLIGWRVLKQRIFAEISQFMTDYIDGTIAYFSENPEKLAPFLDALTKQGMKSLGVTKEQGIPSMKIGGLKIPGYVVQALLPFIEGQAKKMAGSALKEGVESTFG